MNLVVLTQDDVQEFQPQVIDVVVSFYEKGNRISSRDQALQIDEEHVVYFYEESIEVIRFAVMDYGVEIGQDAESVLTLHIDGVNAADIDLDIIENMLFAEILQYLIELKHKKSAIGGNRLRNY